MDDGMQDTLRSELARMTSALEKAERTIALYEDALAEAEAIFGGEYADHYGPMFELAMAARDARMSASAFEWTEVKDHPHSGDDR